MSGHRKPKYYAYQVQNNGDGEKGYWTKIGGAWPHKDGKGLDVRLAALPVDAKLVLRVAEDKKPRPEPSVDFQP